MRIHRILTYFHFLLLGAVASVSFAANATKTGHATAHDGSDIYFEVHGTGSKFLLFGFTLQPRSSNLQEFVKGLGQDYKLVVAEYPGPEPKMYTLTPGAVARDYLAIAKAAGAESFAFYGYSWGAACGLQLALRTDRVKALIAGGFPMIGGPYLQLLDTSRKQVSQIPSLPNAQKGNWEMSRQYLTFFEGLQGFDDSKIQDRLTMPRLNFVGTEDSVMFPGDVKVEFNTLFATHKDQLKSAGWDVLDVQGADHVTAMSAKVSIPLIRKWLQENWPD